MKYMIGIGDSWCSGEGGWPEWLLAKHNYDVQYVKHRSPEPLSDETLAEIEAEEQKHCWLTKLCEKHFPEYEPINLGVPGTGNIAAAKNLQFLDLDLDNSEFIVLYCLSTLDRYDIFNTDMNKWCTHFPYINFNKDDPYTYFSYYYAHELWCKEFSQYSTLSAIVDVQNFVKAHNGKLLVFSGFNQDTFSPDSLLCNKVDWSQYLHTYTDYNNFLELLFRYEDIDFCDPRLFLQMMPRPSTYLTNCKGTHPTIRGHEIIADELATVLNDKYM